MPDGLIDAAVEQMSLELQVRSVYENMASGDTTSFMRDDPVIRQERIRSEVAKQVKTDLVFKQIIEAQHLEVTSEELEQEAKAISERQQVPLETVRGFFGEDMALLRGDLLVRKAIDFIYTNTDTND
jgi:trigger factor